MKLPRDERINLRGTWVRDFIALFLIMIAVNGGYLLIFMTIYEIEPTVANMLRIETVSYMVFFSVVLSAITTALRVSVLNMPTRRLGDAAKRIAQGDFSVRIPPMRKDGRKDHMEVLFEDFNTMAEELSSIETMKNDFIANVSHEIKTPIAIIQSYATALQQEGLDAAERGEYTRTIIDASQRLSALVTNILRLNRLENQEIMQASAPYDLSEQLRCCALAMEDLWEKKELSFTADIEDGVMVRCDESMLELVWNNLLSNAIKFTELGGDIALTLATEGEHAVVSVMDTGCGMDDATVRHVFDKFYQGDTSRAQEGNGLGLSLARKVVDLLGGEIHVESIPSRGTTFMVKIKVERDTKHA